MFQDVLQTAAFFRYVSYALFPHRLDCNRIVPSNKNFPYSVKSPDGHDARLFKHNNAPFKTTNCPFPLVKKEAVFFENSDAAVTY